MTAKIDPKLTQHLNDLAHLANQAGAEGVWLVRGAKYARLSYVPTGQPRSPGADLSFSLNLVLSLGDAGVLVVMRFPASDGGEPGVEKR